MLNTYSIQLRNVFLIPAQYLSSLPASQRPNVTTVSMHPGLVDTDMLMDACTYRHLKLEMPELVGDLKGELGIEQFQ